MKLPHELEDKYVKEVLYNHSLENLPGEQWKAIEGFENYEISNYGRLKSLSRLSHISLGVEHWVSEKIRKLRFTRQYNKYLKEYVYNVHCGLSLEGHKYTRSVARLVYYHFVEKFDVEDRSFVISCKDNNVFNKHSSNLEKISVKEKRLTIFRKNRSRNVHIDYMKPVSQYTVEGEFIASFESIYAVEEKLGIACESIMDVINKNILTSGTFRWFLRNNPPKKEDFYMVKMSDTLNGSLNKYLWEKLGKPIIDKGNPPSCFNLSVKDLPGEYWAPVPISGFESRFVLSNKGRIKRLSGWISKGRIMFLQEKILSQKLIINNEKTYSLSCTLSNEGKYVRVVMSKLLYCCFVEKFDLSDRNLMVVNESDPLWDIDISKLSLHPANYVLKEKYRNYDRPGS
ncbi:NUMOD4 domain-containing protein [Chryseobacterium sp.]|uniref:NUMOD4 domain-containing protein n=1 Tax=Chryseobacterium sp. TaxID=1871047 RepID=UPI00260D7FB8|nr:NUMOD4 domain-containing protein [Chryseobacterium sp.]